jgi:hypothetical protein
MFKENLNLTMYEERHQAAMRKVLAGEETDPNESHDAANNKDGFASVSAKLFKMSGGNGKYVRKTFWLSEAHLELVSPEQRAKLLAAAEAAAKLNDAKKKKKKKKAEKPENETASKRRKKELKPPPVPQPPQQQLASSTAPTHLFASPATNSSGSIKQMINLNVGGNLSPEALSALLANFARNGSEDNEI